VPTWPVRFGIEYGEPADDPLAFCEWAAMKQRGSILVVVLLLASLLAVLLAVAGTVMRAAHGSSRSFADGVRAEVAVRAAIERAMNGVPEIRQTAGSVRLAQGDVVFTARNETARIDLNQAPASLIAGIFRFVGVDAATATAHAARIVDWRDEDDRVSEGGGAERDAYRAVGRVDGPRNGSFLHVAEVARVLGIPQAVAAAVAPYLTVASGNARVNPMLADPPVLLAIPGTNEARVRDFLQERERRPGEFRSLIFRLGPVQNFVTNEAGSAARFEARVRLGPDNERRFEIVVALMEGDGEPYRIISWDANPPSRQTVMAP
jgi:general secretion pathway protein K